MTEKKKNKDSLFSNSKSALRIAIYSFIVLACTIILFFILFRSDYIGRGVSKVIKILEPIIYGMIFAYLLNPAVEFFKRNFLKILPKENKKNRFTINLIHALSIIITLILMISIFFILGYMVIPELYKSIAGLAANLPQLMDNSLHLIEKLQYSDNELFSFIESNMTNFTTYIQQWLEGELLPNFNTFISSFTVGVFEFMKTVFNILIGLIVSIYILSGKETFYGQSKKIIYATLKPEHANVLLDTIRKSNKIFIGFITGKIIDSLIIGILCFIGLSLLNMPYTLLVSVIVGVTNVIPFFGPYIGAIPSAILILITSPIQGLYFIIFILVLQQLDGNVIGPKILGDSTGLSAFWVIFSILLGGGLFGFVGMIMGVPTFAVIYHIGGQILSYLLKKKNLPVESEEYINVKSISNDGDTSYLSEDFVPPIKDDDDNTPPPNDDNFFVM